MIYPTIDNYKKDAKSYSLIPVFREIRVDTETPLSIFLKVKAKFLLESVERGENVGRYSIIGLGKKHVITLTGKSVTFSYFIDDEKKSTETFERDNPLEEVRKFLSQFNAPDYEQLPPFFGGAIGYLGYETVQYFEEIPVIENDSNIPDGILIIPEVILVYDSIKRSVLVIVSSTPREHCETSYKNAVEKIELIAAQLSRPLVEDDTQSQYNDNTEISFKMSKEEYMDIVKTCKNFIVNGECIQVVLSQQFALASQTSPFEMYRTLRVLNPSPYLFFLDFEDFCMIGSSPEVMVRVRDGEILLKPIAGTRKRGDSIAEDDAITKELLADEKELAEHIMLVDLGRNDLGRVAKPGTVEVTEYMSIEKYSHVMHIVSTIKGELDEQYDVFDVIKATFPAGTLSGAPKVRAMQIISKLEKVRRGPYGGMVLNLGYNGNLDSCITIRSAVFSDHAVTVQAGAGIVADSMPELEYEETMNKARALINTIQETGKRSEL